MTTMKEESMLVENRTGWLAWGSAALVFGLGCAGTSGARPDDMSAQAHRREATTHDTQAQDHAAQYDPNATRVRTLGGARRGTDADFGENVYNPTDTHRHAAERHRQHAEDHRSAAAELERFEEAECGSFPASTRPLCPLLGQVASTEPIPQGVRIHLSDESNVAAIEAHARCHLAFARTRGRQGMAECPLYVEGARMGRADAGAIEIVADDPSAAEQIRQRTETHVVEPSR